VHRSVWKHGSASGGPQANDDLNGCKPEQRLVSTNPGVIGAASSIKGSPSESEWHAATGMGVSDLRRVQTAEMGAIFFWVNT